jgi:hypothetical protein
MSRCYLIKMISINCYHHNIYYIDINITLIYCINGTFTYTHVLKYPLITLKVISLIHWEALRLWWKRIPHRRKEADPDLQQGAFRGH